MTLNVSPLNGREEPSADARDFRTIASPNDEAVAQWVRGSIYFDPEFYLSQISDPLAHADPALHYVVIGEGEGATPSLGFSARTYEYLNADLKDVAINRLFHYEAHGRSEGRRHTFETDHVDLDALKIDPGKPTVIVLLHEATYSGAPILGWNIISELKLTRNVVVVLQRGGKLIPALASRASALVGSNLHGLVANSAEMANLAARIKREYEPQYVIANSVETRQLGIALRCEGVPMVALVHEFATHSQPYALTEFYNLCDAIVFPAEIVRQSSLQAYPLIAQRRTYILPQGASEIPRLQAGADIEVEADAAGDVEEEVSLAAILAQPALPFTVVGLGTIDLRKGVDLFVAAATALKARHPDLAFRFIWLGGRVHPLPHAYYTFLDEQVSRSGVKEQLFLADAVDDLEPIYAAADAFFLSSRLDPLPNVGIDAALHGVPLLCFKDATGFAELLEGDVDTAGLVAPYLDTGAIAETLAALASDAERRARAGAAMRRLAKRSFNMMTYVARIDDLGRAAAQRHASYFDQAETLMSSEAFDAELYFGPNSAVPAPREVAVRRYLEDTLSVNFSGGAAWGHHPRRPMPGFHPLIYGDLHPAFKAENQLDPLVDFLRRGRPAGPWIHEVIRLGDVRRSMLSRPSLRLAIHGHFHYTDNFLDFLGALAVNEQPADLFLTTTSEAAARYLQTASASYFKGRVRVEIMPNIGRDVGPFIALLETRLSAYDVVGHMHGKRSAHTFHYDPELGNRWRNFLWQHLIGSAVPVVDIVMDRFAQELDLGMVFPENDFLVGWEKNRELSQALAPRLDLSSLPEHIEFPVGTMFWARPAALQRLVDARFGPEDYPVEPLPIDGTMLHALERLLPLIVEAAGYRCATTYFPQFTR